MPSAEGDLPFAKIDIKIVRETPQNGFLNVTRTNLPDATRTEVFFISYRYCLFMSVFVLTAAENYFSNPSIASTRTFLGKAPCARCG